MEKIRHYVFAVSFPFLLAGAAPALAKPTKYARDNLSPEAVSELLVRYHRESEPKQMELLVSSADKTEVFAHACSDTLEVADVTIAIQVDDTASGSLSVDSKEYDVVGDRQLSGGISCTKLYSQKSTVVECLVPWDNREGISALGMEISECFSDDSADRRRSLPPPFRHPRSAHPAPVHSQNPPDSEPSPREVEKRQGNCPYSVFYKGELVGDGEPYQDVLHRQVGPTQNCGNEDDSTCFVANEQSTTFSVSGSGGLGASFFSGGFAVEKSVTQGSQWGCYQGKGDAVCQWARGAHTAYTMVEKKYETHRSCGTNLKQTSDPFVRRAPNKDSPAEWICIANACERDGFEYWVLGRPGTA